MGRWWTWARARACAPPCALLVALAVPRAGAQVLPGAETSARAGGMADAGAAVGWGGRLDLRANPALVALAPGITVTTEASDRLPGTGFDARLRETGFALSAFGVGLASAGRPWGGTDLAISSTVQLAGGPEPIGWSERLEAKSAAISAAGLADGLGALLGLDGPHVGDWGDIAWGRTWKRATTDAPFLFWEQAVFRDEGWIARVVPIDTRRGSDVPGGGLRVEASFARTSLNGITGGSTALASLTDEEQRTGAGLHLTWWGPSRESAPGAGWIEPFRGAASPPVDVTLAWDRVTSTSRPSAFLLIPSAVTSRVVHDLGAEVALFGLVSGRLGAVSDGPGGIQHPAWGWGARLPFGAYGELRYDFASLPSTFVKRPHRHELALRVDPLARWLRRPSGDATRSGS